MSTRVSVRVKDKRRVSGVPQGDPQELDLYTLGERLRFSNVILRLVASLDIQVIYHDKISGDSFEHSWNIYESNPQDYLDELLPHLKKNERELIKAAHAPMLRPIVGNDGIMYGRAALLLTDDDDSSRRLNTGYVSVGGFTYDGHALAAPYVGIVEGYTEEASRRVALPSAPADAISTWASEQATLIDQSKFLKSQLLRAASRVLRCDGDPGTLPYCFSDGRLITYKETCQIVSDSKTISVPLSIQYQTHITAIGYGRLGVNYFELPMIPGVIVPSLESDRLLDEDKTRLLTKEGRRDTSLQELTEDRRILAGSLGVLLRLIASLWGQEPRLTIETAQIFRAQVHSPPPPRWVLAARR